MIHTESGINNLFLNWADEQFQWLESLLACLCGAGLEVAHFKYVSITINNAKF